MDREKFYLTTAIPYSNAKPHLGLALEFIVADVLASYNRIKGRSTLLLSGSDDNALKNVQAAEREGRDTQEFVDGNAALFKELLGKLGVRVDVFQRGSDRARHYPSSQKLWKLCEEEGDIYKKSYEGLYCVGCEVFYTRDELNERSECLEHPGKALEIVSEENYFFRLSKYQEKLVDLVESGEFRILPDSRKNEVLGFLRTPLQDISISRSNARARNWGVPVPGDDTQRIYVWFDALNIYQSGIGFGWNEEEYKKWWPADVHLIGKGIIRFHAVYWPAFLLSAKLPLPKSIFVHGYITVDGQKMSKTVGNVFDPFELIKKYGAEPLRYYLLREVPTTEDGDFGYQKMKDRYNGDLANGLGNLVARVTTLGEKVSPVSFDFKKDVEKSVDAASDRAFKSYETHIGEFRLNEALADIWRLIAFADRYLNDKKPWAVADPEEFRRVVANACYLIGSIVNMLDPFLPETAEKIREQIRCDDSVFEVKRGTNLFPRL